MKKTENNPPPLISADINWQDNTPISRTFNDFYYSSDNGVQETEHVFLQHNNLADRWNKESAIETSARTFTIAETGFGTGLNFLCAAQLWRNKNTSFKHLHFISVEKSPLTRSDFENACRQFPQFYWIADSLIQQYPAKVRGIHRIQFLDHNITLTLMLGDASECYSTVDGLVDAWFLDGFSPAKNQDMWQPNLFQEMARLSHPSTTVATFTSAAIVKKSLLQAGFSVEKTPGFGLKREMLHGTFKHHQPPKASFPHTEKPWFKYRYQSRVAGSIAVIGAGMAGCTVARSLAQRGWQVRVYEADLNIASQGSGNPTGITFVKPNSNNIPQTRYYQSAYLNSCRSIRNLFAHHKIKEGVDWNLQGIVRLAHNKKEKEEQQAFLESQYWPDELLKPLTAEQVLEQFDFETPYSAILLNGGGWLNPRIYCSQLLNHPNIELVTSRTVSKLDFSESLWRVNSENHPFNAVVLASAFHCSAFPFSEHLPLKAVRGQITYLPATQQSSLLQHTINYDGYINPARDGYHCVGATFTPKNNSDEELTQDHQWNCAQLSDALPDLGKQLVQNCPQPMTGRVGFRCQTPDYLPIVGPMPDIQKFHEDYAPLRKGFLKKPFPIDNSMPGLFISSGHGSRGITSTSLAAEIIASYITGEPQAIDRQVLHAIHPARFMIKDLIRGRTR